MSSGIALVEVDLMTGVRGGLLCKVIGWSLVAGVEDTGAAGY